jgi:hypothetical protein
VDEVTVRRYKADLADEIEPQISELIERAEKGLKSWEAKQAALEAQVKPQKLLSVPTHSPKQNHRSRVLKDDLRIEPLRVVPCQNSDVYRRSQNNENVLSKS